MNTFLKTLLLSLLLLPTATQAGQSPQGYWHISPNCFAYSEMVWSDGTKGQALITLVSKQGQYYLALTATNPRWNFKENWVNGATVQFSPSNKVTFGEAHGVTRDSKGSDPMVITLVDATDLNVQLLRTSTKMTVNDGTGELTLPLNRVGDALEGIRQCISP